MISGTLVVDKHMIEVNEGDHLGTFAYFGVDELRQSTSIFAKSGGVLAGLPWDDLNGIAAYNPDLTLKLFTWLGAKGINLVSGAMAKRAAAAEAAERRSRNGSAEFATQTDPPAGLTEVTDAESSGNKDKAAPTNSPETETERRIAGVRQMETFWLMKMKAQETKMQEVRAEREASLQPSDGDL